MEITTQSVSELALDGEGAAPLACARDRHRMRDAGSGASPEEALEPGRSLSRRREGEPEPFQLVRKRTVIGRMA